MELVLVLTILILAFLLFVSGRVGPDVVAAGVLVALTLSGAVSPEEAFRGFSSFAVITIAALMVIGDGLRRTGVVRWVAKQLEKIIRGKTGRLIFLNTAIPGVMSGFLNIVASAAFFIPVVLRLSKQLKFPHAKVLMPMAFCALIGANLSLIGASHNLVVHSLLEQSRGEGFSFFEFTPVGLVLLAIALAYTFFPGQKLLPGEHGAPDPEEVPVTRNLIGQYGLEDRIFEVWTGDHCFGEGPTLADLRLDEVYEITPLAVIREGEDLRFPEHGMELRPRDMLLLQGRQADVERLTEAHDGLTFMGSPKGQQKYPLSTGELAEAVVPPRSPAIGKSAREIGLPEKYGMTVAAYYRDGEPRRRHAVDEKLRAGDALLVYGPRGRMRDFDPEKELLIYFKPGHPEFEADKKRQAPLAAAVLALAVLTAALGLFPIAVTATTGALLTVVFGIVPLNKVYNAIDLKTLVLIGGMYPLGIALNQSGAADLIGEALVTGIGGFGPVAVLAGITLLSMILTQPIHNAAAAIIMTPIAINAATAMDSNPVAYCVAVVVACSCTFLMPYGHPAPFMVREPGGYRASDYLKFGLGLNLVALAVILVMVPWLWPL